MKELWVWRQFGSILISSFLLVGKPAFGQSKSEMVGWPPVQVISVEQGLPQAFVSGVAQDDAGFIWLGTLGGLARYDGRQVVPFLHNPDQPTSPRNNIVVWLERGGPNHIWLRYENGNIDRMNAQTGQCQHFPRLDSSLLSLTKDRQLHIDRRGNLWGVSRFAGIFRYDVSQNRFTRYRRTTHQLVSDNVSCLTEDRQGRIWAISPTGLSRVSADGQSVQSVRFAAPLSELERMHTNDERVRAFVRPNGEILLNTQTHLLFIHPEKLTIRPVAFASRKLAVDQPLLNQAADGSVHLMAGGTLFQYSDKTGISPVLNYRPLYGNQHGGLQETSMCLDRSGVLWIGANTKGLFRVDLAAPRLKAFRYSVEFCFDALQTGLGLRLSSYFNWPFENPRTAASYHFRTTYDQQGQLWMGVGSEMGYYSFQTRSFTHLPSIRRTAPNPRPIDPVNPKVFVRGIAVLPNKQVWVLDQKGGLLQYQASTRRWQISFGQSDVEARDLVADSSGFWATTGGSGLLHYQLATHTRRAVHFDRQAAGKADEPLLSLHQDSSHPDWLWIGSHRGLIGFNKRTGRFRRFTTADGLPNNTVYSILPDQQGYLWLSTNRGLCRFHPVTHTTLTIGKADGLPGEEFNRFHHLQFPDGRLAFGGVEGWVLFDPAQIKPDTTRPVVMLTGLKINNQPVDARRYPTLVVPALNTLSELRLAHDQNYLTFDFAALNDHQPGRLSYRYKLDGYDPDWTTTAQPTIGYTRLPPGEYTLQVGAFNSTLGLESATRQVVVVVSAPLWASNWAYALYALLLGTAGWAVVRFRMQRTRERRELAMRERQADELRQLDEAKTRFFTNVSHELRTPLTLILAPLRGVLGRQRLDPQDERFLQTADRTAQQMLGLVNELLDLSRLEAGKFDLHPQTVLLNELLTDSLTPFAEQAEQLGVNLLSYLPAEENRWVILDAPKLKRVIQNLLANALKFTPPGGTVTLRATTTDERLQIAVIDTGRGIPPDDLPHVFDRYFQTRQTGSPHEGGTGIGLAICQELIRLMQGTITVSSVPGQGSTFCVDVPLVTTTAPYEGVDESESEDQISATALLPDLVRANGDEDPMAVIPLNHNQLDTDQLILLVEDNLELSAYLSAVLSPPFAVLKATNGQVALDLLAGLPQLPSLIISDIMMPVMDGFQLLETLKNHPTYRTIPVVMLTARADMTDKLRALRLGVDDYLLKPFDEAEITARVTNLLRNQHERRGPAARLSGVAALPVVAEGSEPSPETAEETPALSADDLAWLEHLETVTANRLGDFDLMVDTLADDMAMTRRTFYRAVKRLTGLTPAQYVAEARLHRARLLLETRQVSSVKQVAYAVGYRQVSHFAQLYQQRFGKSPADY